MKPKLLYIGNKLNKHGFNTTTIETLSKNLIQEGFKVKSVSSKKNFFLRFFHMCGVTLFTSEANYILIDTYSTKAFWYAFFCSQIARVRNIKYIPILHGGDLPNRLQKNPYLCKLIFKNAYKNVAPSGYLKHEFEKSGFQNVILIPNTIEITHYNFKERSHFQPKLLWVRAFAKIYNPEMAIQVFSEIQKQFPTAQLTMVGPDKDGSLIETKKFAESLHLQVNFTGKLSKEEWTNLAEAYDIFINTTHFDNTPVSVMEGMALGLPVVSTNVGGIPYMLTSNENALLVNDNQAEEMVNAIESLLIDNKLAKKLTLNARQLVCTMDWQVVKQKWKEILF